uniref:Probable rRNA-processing protein EBP2 n=1 Tax=Sinocyclocheilus rhinocerous TaxID=307959 RepID=A0A673MSV0_9TELE
MEEINEDPQLGFESEEDDDDDDELSDGELQKAFAKGLLKPGLNVSVLEPKKAINNVEGLKKCLAEFKKNLPWVERLDLTNYPAVDFVAKAEGRAQKAVKTSMQRMTFRGRCTSTDRPKQLFYGRCQNCISSRFLPSDLRITLQRWRRPISTCRRLGKSFSSKLQWRSQKRPRSSENRGNMAKRSVLKRFPDSPRMMFLGLDRHGFKSLALQVQTQVIQNRQKQKKAMLSAVKKYQKGMTDKLDFLEGDQDQRPKGSEAKKQINKKGLNAKRKYKDKKFGFGGKKKGSKWNTKDSHDDVSGFKAKMAHGKGGKHFGKGGKTNKRPGKEARRKMKTRK